PPTTMRWPRTCGPAWGRRCTAGSARFLLGSGTWPDQIDVLRETATRKIAIANPKHAPYGRAAVAAMEHYSVYSLVKDKLILGENVSQAAQFVETGACDVGIIALSLALAPAMKTAGVYWEIPASAHPSIEQGAVILRSSKQQDAAQTFLEFIKSEPAQEVMKRYGFTLPN
ncbi:molybdate ABC transporter substrate-binding protein, partial [Petrachloros mirabilis]